MRGREPVLGASVRARTIAIVAVVCVAIASCHVAASGTDEPVQYASRTVHIEPVGRIGGESIHTLAMACDLHLVLRYTWRSDLPVRFSIQGPDGTFVRVIANRTSGVSDLDIGREGSYVLRWSNPSTLEGTDLAYTVRVVPPVVIAHFPISMSCFSS